MNINKVCILGGSGFVGAHIVNKLYEKGCEVRVLTRSAEKAKDLTVLPTVEVIEANVFDSRELNRWFAGMDAVINLVGILHEEKRGGFQRVHVDLPRMVVEACIEQKVPRLCHMSAHTADPEGPSVYLRTKGMGEALVREAGRTQNLAVTIFRPSVIFGREDTFLNLFARLVRTFPVLPLANPDARLQPVFVEDVAHAYAASLDNPATFGQTYDLCGPQAYSLQELVKFVAHTLGHCRYIIRLGPRLSYLQAWVLEHAPGKTLMTRDNYHSLQVDNVCSGPFPPIFGITPATIEAVVPTYLADVTPRGRYDILRRWARR